MRAAAVFGVALALAAGCVASEVTMVGPARPARDPSCPVSVIPVGRPAVPYVDVATARARCHFTYGRSECVAELQRRACAVGADLVYGFGETVAGENTSSPPGWPTAPLP
jgi:hypothetical protein